MISELCFAKDTMGPTVKSFFNDRMVQHLAKRTGRYNFLQVILIIQMFWCLAKRTVHYDFLQVIRIIRMRWCLAKRTVHYDFLQVIQIIRMWRCLAKRTLHYDFWQVIWTIGLCWSLAKRTVHYNFLQVIRIILLKRRSTNLNCDELMLHITVQRKVVCQRLWGIPNNVCITEKWFASVFQGYEKMFVEPNITNPEMSLWCRYRLGATEQWFAGVVVRTGKWWGGRSS